MNNFKELDIEKLNKADAPTLIKTVFDTYGERASIGTSLQKTGVVIIDIAKKVCTNFRVHFIDTLLNHQETYEFIKQVEKHYNINIEIYKPDEKDIDNLYRHYGKQCYLFSAKERQACCNIRKVLPAKKAEKNLNAVISGVRADQSQFRKESFSKIMIEKKTDRIFYKIFPLFDWPEEKLDEYIKENNVPLHPLYNYVSEYGEKYKVIGCKCCHFPVQSWRGKRAGKWPWEAGKKECGINYIDGGGI